MVKKAPKGCKEEHTSEMLTKECAQRCPLFWMLAAWRMAAGLTFHALHQLLIKDN